MVYVHEMLSKSIRGCNIDKSWLWNPKLNPYSYLFGELQDNDRLYPEEWGLAYCFLPTEALEFRNAYSEKPKYRISMCLSNMSNAALQTTTNGHRLRVKDVERHSDAVSSVYDVTMDHRILADKIQREYERWRVIHFGQFVVSQGVQCSGGLLFVPWIPEFMHGHLQ